MSTRWTPESWRSKPVVQMPTDYPDASALSAAALAMVELFDTP